MLCVLAEIFARSRGLAACSALAFVGAAPCWKLNKRRGESCFFGKYSDASLPCPDRRGDQKKDPLICAKAPTPPNLIAVLNKQASR